jgi:hypothetical protein
MTETTAPMAPNTISVGGFFTDEGFDFITRMVIGYAAQGVLDVGQVFATIARITDGDADSWYTAWRETADKLHSRATTGLAAAHIDTAHRLFLAASESYSQANAFADSMTDNTRFAETFALQRQCWEAFVDSSQGCIVRVEVPCGEAMMPGYLLRPDTTGAARPTLVLTNGSEGSISGLWANGASTALARGWNAFLYDGPGQQTMLFDQGVPFRPDWEAVLTPIVDALVARADVDPGALFAYGISQAGYWVTRALAFEHRFVAAVVDPGVVDVSTTWLSNLPAVLIEVLRAGDKDTFNAAMAAVAQDPKMAEAMAFRGRPFGQSTAYDTFAAVLQYNVADVAGAISTPLLITDPDDETFWPGQSDQLAGLLPGEHRVVRFHREDGANFHCQPMARADTEFIMFDFFTDQLNKRAPHVI